MLKTNISMGSPGGLVMSRVGITAVGSFPKCLTSVGIIITKTTTAIIAKISIFIDSRAFLFIFRILLLFEKIQLRRCPCLLKLRRVLALGLKR